MTCTLIAQTGVVKSYYSNGQKRAEISYSDGIYDGTSYWFYENGNLKEEVTFSNGKVNGWVRSYYESGLLKEEKYVIDGKLDGITKKYYANGALAAIMNYENGFLIKSTKFDFDPYYQAPIDDYQAGNRQQKNKKKEKDEFLCDAKICPEPLGGMGSIYKKLGYPYEARAYGLEGTVKLIAKINRAGKVIETKLIKGIGLGCDEAAAEAVKKTLFLPGQNESGPITANITLNIEFKLEDEKISTASINSELTGTESTSAPTLGEASKPAVAELNSDEPRVLYENRIDEDSLKKSQKSEKDSIELSDDELNDRNFINCEGVDVCAEPVGGINAVIRNFKIPQNVIENDVKGVVIIQCEVNERGKVRNTLVKKGLPHGASVAAEVALIYTKFNPALKNGKPIKSKVTVTVPINY